MRQKDLTILQMAGSVVGGIGGALVWQVLGLVGIPVSLLVLNLFFVLMGSAAGPGGNRPYEATAAHFGSGHGQAVLDMGVTMAWMAVIPWFLVGPASKRGPMWRLAAISMAVVSSLFGLSAAVIACGIASGS